jgi:DNA processing protein
VLGTGVDVAYPRAHRALHAELAQRGLVVSEELPGERATPGSFPKRNRVLAALAAVTIVVEAPRRSGALITAGHALDLGRAVAAVPGSIEMPSSVGSNELIRDGAAVIASFDDAPPLFGVARPTRVSPTPAPANDIERRVWSALAGGPIDLDALLQATGLDARSCLTAISALELAGAVASDGAGRVHRR